MVLGGFMTTKKIAITLPLEENTLGPLHTWGEEFDWSEIAEVHFLHVVKKQVTSLEFGVIENPDEKTYQQMVPALEQHMRSEAMKILPRKFTGQVFYHLTKQFSVEEEVISLIKKLGLSLIVVSTRGIHGLKGLFHTSFAEKMIKFAPCDVYIVRPKAFS